MQDTGSMIRLETKDVLYAVYVRVSLCDGLCHHLPGYIFVL